jgi:hypothetical protein
MMMIRWWWYGWWWKTMMMMMIRWRWYDDDDETMRWGWKNDDEGTMMMKERWWWNGDDDRTVARFLHFWWKGTREIFQAKNWEFRVKLNSGYFITRPVFAPPNPIEAQKRPSTTFPLKARVPVHETAGKRTWTRTKHGKPPSARKNVRTYVRAREPDYIGCYWSWKNLHNAWYNGKPRSDGVGN